MKIIFSLYNELVLLYLLLYYLLVNNYTILKLALIEIILIIVFSIFKFVLKKQRYIKLPKIFYRPDKSYGCNSNIQKSNKGEIGLPSIHSLVSMFLVVGFYKLKNYPLLLLSLLVPLTRLGDSYSPKFISCCQSGCHTLLQVIIGCIIGLVLGIKFI